jgi:hypothetical protein
MPRSIDGSSPAGTAEADEGERFVLERQKEARRVAEQSWPSFFKSLALRTLLVIVLVLAAFWCLRLFSVLGR